MKNVLLLCCQYPPMIHVASLRNYGFAKHLVKQGYNVTVLTEDNNQDFEQKPNLSVIGIPNKVGFKPKFTSAENKFRHMVKVAQNILTNQIIIDDRKKWTRKAFAVAYELIVNKPINTIISSYAPIAPHLVALNLKRKFPSLLWIADMRDELASNSCLPMSHRSLNPLLPVLEQRILNESDIITSVSEPLLQDFKGRRTTENGYFVEVKNGYEFELDTYSKPNNNNFVITYAGSLGGRDPSKFLVACSDLVDGGLRDIKINFIGTNKNLDVPYNIKNIVECIPQVTYSQSIQFLRNSDLLLLIIPYSRRRGVYTTKIFDYLGTLRPILAIVPPDDVAANLIKRARAGFVADPNNINSIKTCLLEAYTNWKTKSEFIPDLEFILSLDRGTQIQALIKIMEHVRMTDKE